MNLVQLHRLVAGPWLGELEVLSQYLTALWEGKIARVAPPQGLGQSQQGQWEEEFFVVAYDQASFALSFDAWHLWLR